MARITVEDCIDKFPSRFELVLVATQRARKLHSGDTPTVEKNNDKNTVISLREIADSTISVDQMKENLIQEYQTVTINDEEEENLELENLENDHQTSKNEEDSKTMDPSKDVEQEMKELISTENSEIEQNYEISDNLEGAEISHNDDEEISHNDDEEISHNDDEVDKDKKLDSENAEKDLE